MYFAILKEDKIPLEDFAAKLFDESGEQEIIPFLGAGVVFLIYGGCYNLTFSSLSYVRAVR